MKENSKIIAIALAVTLFAGVGVQIVGQEASWYRPWTKAAQAASWARSKVSDPIRTRLEKKFPRATEIITKIDNTLSATPLYGFFWKRIPYEAKVLIVGNIIGAVGYGGYKDIQEYKNYARKLARSQQPFADSTFFYENIPSSLTFPSPSYPHFLKVISDINPKLAALFIEKESNYITQFITRKRFKNSQVLQFIESLSFLLNDYYDDDEKAKEARSLMLQKFFSDRPDITQHLKRVGLIFTHR